MMLFEFLRKTHQSRGRCGLDTRGVQETALLPKEDGMDIYRERSGISAADQGSGDNNATFVCRAVYNAGGLASVS